MYGSTKLLTDEHFGVWFEIYERREQITILVLQTDEQRRTDNQRLTVNELMERESVQSTLSKCTLSKCTLSLNAWYFRFPTSGISDKCTLSLFCMCN